MNRYVLIYAVGIGSFIAASLLPIEAFLRAMIAIPGVLSLGGAVFMILRDHNEYLRRLDLQERRQDFDLAVASHMANCVFDKHVTFCEEYVQKINDGIRTLVSKGPDRVALNIAGELAAIRVK